MAAALWPRLLLPFTSGTVASSVLFSCPGTPALANPSLPASICRLIPFSLLLPSSPFLLLPPHLCLNVTSQSGPPLLEWPLCPRAFVSGRGEGGVFLICLFICHLCPQLSENSSQPSVFHPWVSCAHPYPVSSRFVFLKCRCKHRTALLSVFLGLPRGRGWRWRTVGTWTPVASQHPPTAPPPHLHPSFPQQLLTLLLLGLCSRASTFGSTLPFLQFPGKVLPALGLKSPLLRTSPSCPAAQVSISPPIPRVH